MTLYLCVFGTVALVYIFVVVHTPLALLVHRNSRWTVIIFISAGPLHFRGQLTSDLSANLR